MRVADLTALQFHHPIEFLSSWTQAEADPPPLRGEILVIKYFEARSPLLSQKSSLSMMLDRGIFQVLSTRDSHEGAKN